MGQANSQEGSAATIAPQWLQARIQKQAGEIKQLVSLTYTDFVSSLKDLNKITHSFCDINGKQLQFKVKKGTDSTILWKGTVRVRCHKVNGRSGVIESTRLLNLKQYINLYNEIMRQANVAIAEQGTLPAQNLCASMILNELNIESIEDKDEEECCICMDRKAEVILPCAHIYCEMCIDEWNVNHKTCPICRATVKSSDETWVLTEKPDESEMAFETTDYLMGLAERTGIPSKSPND